MVGRVVAINRHRESFSVLTEDGHTVVELMDEVELRIGDDVKGNLDDHGDARLVHVQSGQSFHGYVQAIHATAAFAAALVGK